jgi:hypothetical protein
MGQGITQWTQQNKTNDKSLEKRVLEKVKKLEEKRLSEGWKFVQISRNTQICVPCGKSGKPTKEGLRRIRIMKELCGIT